MADVVKKAITANAVNQGDITMNVMPNGTKQTNNGSAVVTPPDLTAVDAKYDGRFDDTTYDCP